MSVLMMQPLGGGGGGVLLVNIIPLCLSRVAT